MTLLTNANEHGLGRVEQFDDRSRNYPVRALIPATATPRSYTWSCETVLNQGNEGTCVGHAWAHEIAARPVRWPVNRFQARLIYREACLIDPWSQNDAPDWNFGTSVLAGAKTATQLGHYNEYRWAFGLDDLCLALGYKGPAVLGISWYSSMFDPDANGLLHISGSVAGGHAILANGISISKRVIRLHNSWGNDWGFNGEAFISFDDLGRLLREGGEACIPVIRTKTS